MKKENKLLLIGEIFFVCAIIIALAEISFALWILSMGIGSIFAIWSNIIIFRNMKNPGVIV